MTDVSPSIGPRIQIESVDQNSANSEAIQTEIASRINGLIAALPNRQKFTSNGTFTAPSDLQIGFAILIGRGGSGGGSGGSFITGPGGDGGNGGNTTFAGLATFFGATGGSSANFGTGDLAIGGEGHGGGKNGGYAGSPGPGNSSGGQGDSVGGNGGLFFNPIPENHGAGGGGTENTVKVVSITAGASYAVTIGSAGSGGAGNGGSGSGTAGQPGELTVIYF
jgi:hypothetical protein